MGKYASKNEKKQLNKLKRKREIKSGKRKIRALIYRRISLVGKKCVRCGKVATQRHSKSKHKRIEEGDIILLCDKCHVKQHQY